MASQDMAGLARMLPCLLERISEAVLIRSKNSADLLLTVRGDLAEPGVSLESDS